MLSNYNQAIITSQIYLKNIKSLLGNCIYSSFLNAICTNHMFQKSSVLYKCFCAYGKIT